MKDNIFKSSVMVKLCACICILLLLGSVHIGASTKETINETQVEYENEKPEPTLENKPDAITRSQMENQRINAIEAGHSVSVTDNINVEYEEKSFTLNVALMLEEILLPKGYEVHISHYNHNSIEIHNKVNEDGSPENLLISLHHNTSFADEGLNGIETRYNKKSNDGNYRLVRAVHRKVVEFTDSLDRGIIVDEEIIVVSDEKMPSCLVEMDYMPNDLEYQWKIASAIAGGAEDFFNPKTLYMTFDDGPSDKTTGVVLDILRDNNIKATFFVIGEKVRANPELAQRIVAEGHTVGIHCDNHTYTRLYASKESYIADFEKAYNSVVEIMGVQPDIYRFPGGSVNSYNKEVYKDIIEEMTERGFEYFDWNVSIDDAVKNTSQEMLLINAEKGINNKERVILLAHDTHAMTVGILQELLDMLVDYKTDVLNAGVKPMHFRKQ